MTGAPLPVPGGHPSARTPEPGEVAAAVENLAALPLDQQVAVLARLESELSSALEALRD